MHAYRTACQPAHAPACEGEHLACASNGHGSVPHPRLIHKAVVLVSCKRHALVHLRTVRQHMAVVVAVATTAAVVMYFLGLWCLLLRCSSDGGRDVRKCRIMPSNTVAQLLDE